jgi:hypothetical protein
VSETGRRIAHAFDSCGGFGPQQAQHSAEDHEDDEADAGRLRRAACGAVDAVGNRRWWHEAWATAEPCQRLEDWGAYFDQPTLVTLTGTSVDSASVHILGGHSVLLGQSECNGDGHDPRRGVCGRLESTIGQVRPGDRPCARPERLGVRDAGRCRHGGSRISDKLAVGR